MTLVMQLPAVVVARPTRCSRDVAFLSRAGDPAAADQDKGMIGGAMRSRRNELNSLRLTVRVLIMPGAASHPKR